MRSAACSMGFLGAGSVLVVGCASAPEASCDGPPVQWSGGGGNVMVVLLDDVGLDKVGAYEAHPRPAPTPVLNGLGEVGLRFDQAYTSPSCSPTRASLLTGRRPHRHGVGRWIEPRSPEAVGLDASERTLPEVLAEAPTPYTSALIGKWHLSVFDGDAALDPLRHGFAHHRGSLGNLEMAEPPAPRDRGWWHWQKNTDGALAMHTTYATIDTTDEALGLVASMPEPWFALVAYNGAHEPWHVPPAELHDLGQPAGPRGRMDAMVASLDREIGRLLAGVDLDQTTVFVLSDNGTAPEVVREPWLAERGKHSLHDAGVHVPMWALGLGVEAFGERTDALVHVTDLFATIADLAGVERDGVGAELDGQSLVPLLSEVAKPDRRCVITEQIVPGRPDLRSRSIRDGRFELIREVGRHDRFYDLGSGPTGAEPELEPGALEGKGLEAFERLTRALDEDDERVAARR